MPIYLKKWYNAKWICVFREPSSFLESAKKLSQDITMQTWIEYYSRVLQKEPVANILWVAYEDLINKKIKKINELIRYVRGESTESEITQKLLSIIQPSLNRCSGTPENLTHQAAFLYQKLKNKSEIQS